MDFLDIFSTTVLPWSHARKKKFKADPGFFLGGVGGGGGGNQNGMA